MTATLRYIVHDVAAAAIFYRDFLGSRVDVQAPGGFAALSLGDLRLLLNQPGAGGAGQPVAGDTPAPGGWNRFQIEVSDITEAVERLRRAGATFRSGPVAGRGGVQALLQDPSGNLVELFQPATPPPPEN